MWIRRRSRDGGALPWSRSRRQQQRRRESLSVVAHDQEEDATGGSAAVDEAEIQDILEHTRQVTDSLRLLQPRRSF